MSSPPPVVPDDGSDVPSTDSSNYTLLYIIIAVLIGVILFVGIRYGRSVLEEYRMLQAGGGGAARVGLSADEIAGLPTFTYRVRSTSVSPLAGGGGNERRRSGSKGRAPGAVECVVCLQELDDGDVVRVLPACRHFFHGGCIDVWLRAHTSCPVCRTELDPEAERDRLGEVAMISPPLPQLRRCGVSPERPSSASRVLADILARSPLRSPSPTPRGYARMDDLKPPSPGLSEIRVVRSKTPSPMRLSSKHLSPSPTRSIGVLESAEVITSPLSAPMVPEIVIARSVTPSPTRFNTQVSPRSVGVLESTEVITSPSSAPVVPEIVISRSLTPSPIRLKRQPSPRSIAVVENSEAITTLASPSSMPTGEGGGGSLSKSPSPVHIQ